MYLSVGGSDRLHHPGSCHTYHRTKASTGAGTQAAADRGCEAFCGDGVTRGIVDIRE